MFIIISGTTLLILMICEVLLYHALGGNSNNGVADGAFARNFNNDAGNSNWNRRGRRTIFVSILRVRISSRSRGTIKRERQRKASRFKKLVNPNESWRSQDSNISCFLC